MNWRMSGVVVLSLGGSSLACDPHTRDDPNPGQFINVGGASGQLSDPEIDHTITLGPANTGSQDVHPGQTVTVNLPFDAPNANVVGAGIRFGTDGPVINIPIAQAQGQTSGTMQFSFDIPPDICSNLSDICHDIKCYEFAVTSVGKVSVANINALALACGDCDEPSCQSLLNACEIADCNVEGCPANQICLDSLCVPQTAQNSCAARNPSCCPGQDDSCMAPDSQCLCDAFCVDAGDCCPDACQTCGFCG